MKIFYKKDSHLGIWFNANELKAGLATLKGMANYFKMDFIFKAAREVELDIYTPKLPPPSPHHHICVKCFTEIDTRKDEHLVKDGDYTHKECPKLKDNRPV